LIERQQFKKLLDFHEKKEAQKDPQTLIGLYHERAA
jgi:hypothetical protein